MESPEGAVREKGGRKNIWRNKSWKFPKFDEGYEFIYVRCLTNSKQDELKETHWDTFVVKLSRERQKNNLFFLN